MNQEEERYTEMETAGGDSAAPADTISPQMSCSEGWFVSGYYTPCESEFHGRAVSIL
jgi:hypothetical protein